MRHYAENLQSSPRIKPRDLEHRSQTTSHIRNDKDVQSPMVHNSQTANGGLPVGVSVPSLCYFTSRLQG